MYSPVNYTLLHAEAYMRYKTQFLYNKKLIFVVVANILVLQS